MHSLDSFGHFYARAGAVHPQQLRGERPPFFGGVRVLGDGERS